MRQGFCQWKAYALGLAMSVNCGTVVLYAGTVSPPIVDPLSAIDSAMPSQLDGDLDQSHWVSAANIDAISLSTVPVSQIQTPLGATALTPTPIIPLPGAAWTGMAGLVALAVARGMGTFRRFLR